MTALIRAKLILLKRYIHYLPIDEDEKFRDDIDDLMGLLESWEIQNAKKNCGITKIENEIKLPKDPPKI